MAIIHANLGQGPESKNILVKSMMTVETIVTL